MKLKNPMLIVTDIEKSVEFYKDVLGLEVVMDFGANKTLTGGLVLQTAETYRNYIGTDEISFGGKTLRFILKKMISISSLSDSRSSPLSMSTP